MYLTSKQKNIIIKILKDKVSSLKAIYLFGSYADNSANISSDIDIAYLSKQSFSTVNIWEISKILALELNKDIDLIDISKTNTIFRYQIISNGKQLYGSGYDVDSFELLAYSFYLRFQEERKPIVDAIYADKRVLNV